MSRVPGRAARVCLLLGVVFALSLLDLYLTLLYVTHTGMDEANPVARLLLQHGSLGSVAAFKLGTVGLCSYILFRARRTSIGEFGAWLAAGVLITLTAHWINFGRYQAVIAQASSVYGVHATFDTGPEWVDRTGIASVPIRRAG